MTASPEPSKPVNYGFVGIGVMGYGMAMNLRAKIPSSSKFFLCEINEARREQFLLEVEGEVEVVRSPREMAEKADIIVTMLPKAQHVNDVFTNPSTGFLSCMKENCATSRLFIDCSTIDTGTSKYIGSLVNESGIGSFLDAPVSGGPQGAVAGTLTFMVGGSDALFAQTVPVLSMMGVKENIFHCGTAGAGLATKALNNYMGYVGFMGLCEAMNTGLLYGLDPRVLANVINQSSGMNWNSLHHNPVKGVNPDASSARDFKGGFTTELAAGVIDDAVLLMQSVGARSVMSAPVQGVFQRALKSERCRGMEARSVWRLFNEEGGKELEGL